MSEDHDGPPEPRQPREPGEPAESSGRPGSAPGRRRPRDNWLAVMRRFWRVWGLLAFLLLLLIWFRRIVLPFIFATLVAYLLEPLVRRMAPALGERRGLSVIILYVGLLGLGAGFLGGVLPGVISDLSTLGESTPTAVAKLNEEWLPRVSEWFEDTFPGVLGDEAEGQEQVSEVVVRPEEDGSYRVDLRGTHLEVHESGGGWVIETQTHQRQTVAEIIRDIVASKGDELTEVAAEAVRVIVTGIAAFVTDLVITFLIAAFILIDLERVQHFIRSLVPDEHLHDFDHVVGGIDEGMAAVIRGQLLICLINGTLAYVGLAVLGVRYSLLLAMVAAILSIIPVFGILIAAIPLVAVALVSGDIGLEGLMLWKGLGLLGWVVAIHLLESNYLNQRMIGTADIHPLTLIFALLAGWEVYGPIGAVLALPVASMIQTVFVYVRKQANRAAHERDPGASGVARRWDTARHKAIGQTGDGSDA